MEDQQKVFLIAHENLMSELHAFLLRFDDGRINWQIEAFTVADSNFLNRITFEKAILVADSALIPEQLKAILLKDSLPLVLLESADSDIQTFLNTRNDTFIRLVLCEHGICAPQVAESLISLRRNLEREQHHVAQRDEIGNRFQNLLKALPDIVYILDEKGRFVFLNDAVREVGYEPHELTGRHFSEILHEDDRTRVSREAVLAQIRSQDAFPEVSPKLFDERRSGLRMTRDLEVRILNKTTGRILYGLVNAYGESTQTLANGMNDVYHGPVTMGIIHNITAVKLYQKSLEENLAAKELLLREIHHRVKNNLQVIASLTHLRQMEVDDEKTQDVLAGLIAQIKSMAMVHEALYQTENLQGVSAKDYFESFARFMEQTYSYIGSPVILEVSAQDCLVDVEQLSYLAMIASELVSNAYKHAFPKKRSGFIRISFSLIGEEYIMSVEDNGIGVKAEVESGNGLGLEIVQALARQLGARLEKNFDTGIKITLQMPKRRLD